LRGHEGLGLGIDVAISVEETEQDSREEDLICLRCGIELLEEARHYRWCKGKKTCCAHGIEDGKDCNRCEEGISENEV